MSSGNPPQYSNPGEYNSNPNSYSAFDTSGLSNSMIANSNVKGSNQIAQAKAQAAGNGGGRSSGLQNSVGQIEAGMGANAQNILNSNALTSYNQQTANMQNENQYKLGKAGLLNSGVASQASANAANSASTKQNMESIAALIAMLA